MPKVDPLAQTQIITGTFDAPKKVGRPKKTPPTAEQLLEPSKPKRQLSDKQKANLAAGRETLAKKKAAAKPKSTTAPVVTPKESKPKKGIV